MGNLKCDTKYPIMLVHGVGFRDDLTLFNYWGEIPNVLKKQGAVVFLSGHNACAAHSDNALLLKNQILKILKETGSEKINIIAHSKGGIESRYMISKLQMASKVASLTTLASPHRGSTMAKIILRFISAKPLNTIADIVAQMSGDENPDCAKACLELTPGYMEKFNKEVLDVPDVYYQSYGGIIGKSYPNKLWRKFFSVLYKAEGDNDGMVSLESCQWGKFKGIVKQAKSPLVSHADIVGLTVLSGGSFNAPSFFTSLVQNIKAQGF